MHGLAVIWLLPSHLELMLTPLEKVTAGVKDAVTREKSSFKVLIREDNQRGVYTTRPFRKGQFVAEYVGWRVCNHGRIAPARRGVPFKWRGMLS